MPWNIVIWAYQINTDRVSLLVLNITYITLHRTENSAFDTRAQVGNKNRAFAMGLPRTNRIHKGMVFQKLAATMNPFSRLVYLTDEWSCHEANMQNANKAEGQPTTVKQDQEGKRTNSTKIEREAANDPQGRDNQLAVHELYVQQIVIAKMPICDK